MSSKVWIRPEDSDHPKLERLRRAVSVSVGTEADVSVPWATWGAGLTRSWLFAKLEVGAQVLILPPWPEGDFAGLPAVRTVAAPSNSLTLQEATYSVGATFAMEPTPAWQGHGLFFNTKVAWLLAHEPYVGAGKAWLCTAELLVASASTRPREARRLIGDLIAYLTSACRRGRAAIEPEITEGEQTASQFAKEEAPYLLAILGLPGPADREQTAQFVYRRLGVDPDMTKIEAVLARPEVQMELAQPIGSRMQLAKVVDSFGFRNYRIEIEETAQ